MQLERHRVDVVDVNGVDDRIVVDVAEEADLPSRPVVQRAVGADHDHLGVDAPTPQLGDRVLGRLGLELLAGGQVRDQGHVDVAGVGGADVLLHLTDRLEERQALDVAHGAADLGDHHVDVVPVAELADPGLDLIGDVGDDLDGGAEIVAATLLADDRLVDGAGGDVGVAAQALVEEPLVVAQVEVRLAAVVGDEHLAVLERVHRPRVDVDVRVELLGDHSQPARLEETGQRRRGDPLAQARCHSTGDEHVLGQCSLLARSDTLPATRSRPGDLPAGRDRSRVNARRRCPGSW